MALHFPSSKEVWLCSSSCLLFERYAYDDQGFPKYVGPPVYLMSVVERQLGPGPIPVSGVVLDDKRHIVLAVFRGSQLYFITVRGLESEDKAIQCTVLFTLPIPARQQERLVYIVRSGMNWLAGDAERKRLFFISPTLDTVHSIFYEKASTGDASLAETTEEKAMAHSPAIEVITLPKETRAKVTDVFYLQRVRLLVVVQEVAGSDPMHVDYRRVHIYHDSGIAGPGTMQRLRTVTTLAPKIPHLQYTLHRHFVTLHHSLDSLLTEFTVPLPSKNVL
jgi:hypothetical protein